MGGGGELGRDFSSGKVSTPKTSFDDSLVLLHLISLLI